MGYTFTDYILPAKIFNSHLFRYHYGIRRIQRGAGIAVQQFKTVHGKQGAVAQLYTFT